MILFNSTNQTGSILIDNLEVISLTSDLKSTAMSLNLNNGSKTTELVTMVAGDDISKLPVPEKSGCTFAGWYTDSALTQKCEVVPETTEQYISLYAGYDVPYYTVTEDYQRYTGANVQENLSSEFPDGQTFAVEEDNGNKYLHIVTDGTSISNKFKITYHNHAWEFAKYGDKTVLQHILDGTNSKQLSICLDVYWAQYGGADVRHTIDQLAGRLDIIHLKDMARGEKEPFMAYVGEGNLYWQGIIDSARNAGVKYFVVEQDDCQGRDPFECLKKSYEYLREKIK